jgi:hypothetical protein
LTRVVTIARNKVQGVVYMILNDTSVIRRYSGILNN